ncbi:nibrin isoform X2 [Channa argus]|uniref:nibrin isoform X2 n=1 Tax=Channa argus TaxID=215402 RepID=UPI003521C3B9
MWILTPLQPEGETHYLLSSKEYVVGRKNCDILLPNDQSISRAHALLTATNENLILQDTSKYGTFVNSQRVAENTPVNVKSGVILTFGVFQSKFSVDHQKALVCSSCLDNEGKSSLSQALVVLGGKLVNTWTLDCTHLAMPSVKLTIKTISALLCCRPIVKPEFFSEVNKAVQQKLPPPKVESFIPEIDEPSFKNEDVNLGVIRVRKQLFIEKTFIFLSAKQLKRLSAAVSFGGGRSQLLEEGSLPRGLLESPHSCVVDVTTASSQTVLSSSTTEWANSVKNIVQRKGFRVITESEIGLAAIYASCDKFCNPSSLIPDSESVPKVNPRMANASLSQKVEVDETVLPGASQNITAYALNTEQSGGTQLCDMTGATAVGETPEKKQNHNTIQLHGSKLMAQTSTQCIVERKNPESKPTDEGNSAFRGQLSTLKNNGGMKTFVQKQSPQKQKISAHASPQKQSTLTSFFQPVTKKRPLEDECSRGSKPKRPVMESSIHMQAPNTSITSKETYAHSDKVPALTLQTSVGSEIDQFTGRSEVLSPKVSHTGHKDPQNRKRKEMEAEIQMDELISIMSEDMDCFDEQPLYNQGHQAQPVVQSSVKQKQGLNTTEVSFLCKRQKVNREENGTNQRPQQMGWEKNLGSNKEQRQRSEQHIISIKTEEVHASEYKKTNHESSNPPESSFASTSKDLQPFDDNDVSFVEDLELLKVDVYKTKEETKTPLEPVTIKQETHELNIDEGLPKRLVLVEFRSLTLTAPQKSKPKQMQGDGCAKNFKCFRKNRVPGAQGSAHIIGGSDLLVHNRGKNSDLDEWLKDAAEEERQSRRDGTIGDDLFSSES